MDLEALLDRCRRRDELAWEALVRRTQARVYGLALHLLRRPEEARDVAQEVYVKVWESLPGFRGHETFAAWISRITRNACIDHVRRRRARPPSSDLPIEDQTDIADPRPDPGQEWATGLRRRLVWQALGRLSTRSREVIVLKEIQGLTMEEIASLLDVPIGTIKSRSNRARLELARQVMALGGAPPPEPVN
jgi:RNA polymerase sigma-70 factor, ECF subfamily